MSPTRMACSRLLIVGLILCTAYGHAGASSTEFCIDGRLDLGVRLQGMNPAAGEWTPTRWCVLTEDDSERVRFSGSGRANPDMEGGWTVAYLPPDFLRIVEADDPPDIEFPGADSSAEAARNRRIDPRRLLAELEDAPDDGWAVIPGRHHDPALRVQLAAGHVSAVETTVDLPLRGRVPIAWHWDWTTPDAPRVEVLIEGQPVFRGQGRWRTVPDDEVARAYAGTPGPDPVQVPGELWPSDTDMQLEPVGDGVYIAQGVRTGFHHLVVDTADGLVVGDAPAGWVELQQLPPADLVPGLGISGLSERFIDALARELPGRPIFAVALTHVHDDHAGGARAFAAAGAELYAPAEVTGFLQDSLNRSTYPQDRLGEQQGSVAVTAVHDPVTIADRVRLLPMGASPHTEASIGMLDTQSRLFFVSDLHVPGSEDPEPRADRAATECWFAGWVAGNLDDDVTVINSHTLVQTPVSRLSAYLETDTCANL